MTGKGEPLSDADAVRLLEEQKRRHVRLQERQRLVGNALAQRARELDKARAEARAAYGTDDPTELAALLAAQRERNVRAVLEFRDHLDAVERRLAEIDAEAAE